MDRREDQPSLATSAYDILTESFQLKWNVNFQTSRIEGEVILNLRILHNGVSHLLLDTSNLEIEHVENTSSSEKLPFQLKEPHKCLGTPLEITLPSTAQKDSILGIRIVYKTAPSASALQWLKPAQTAGKSHPYLFSQCQPILARSLMPCQDSPAIKSRYEAKVTVPCELIALMSAQRCGEEPNSDPSKKTYLFKQDVPIPSYLLAIVVGKLESRKIGPRTLVWSEKELVDQGAFEFSETEKIIQIAEDMLGPYVWGQCDLLVLPPSFPYGGMENPCLIFMTPSCLAGDKSMVKVLAHEIAHSWTGNLVTNCSWEHMWLNEGFTVFLERKLIARLSSKQHRDFLYIGGWQALHDDVERYRNINYDYTKLIPKLEDVDPDDAYCRVPYEKGSLFLYYLEKLVGSDAEFEEFLKSYIEKFKYKSINTGDWRTFFLSYFQEKAAAGVFDEVDWDQWLFGNGMPPVKPSYDTTLSTVCTDLCSKWAKAREEDLINFSSVDIQDMDSSQIMEFLSLLLLEPPLSHTCIREMKRCFNFGASGNCEIKFRWLRLCLRASYEAAIPHAIEFATKWGRMTYVRPLFRNLFKFGPAKQRAIAAFNDHRDNMHPITSAMIARDLQEVTG